MDVRLLYNQLLEEIHADEAALQEKHQLVRLLKKRLEPEVTHAAVPPMVASESTRRVTLVDADPPPLPRPLPQLVEMALPFMAGREFVVGDVADAIRGKMHMPLHDKPNVSISTILKRMETAGAIVRTFSGAGSVPNRYRLAGEVAGQQQAATQPTQDIA